MPRAAVFGNLWSGVSTARLGASLSRRFRVTHRFHPLHGHELALVGYRRSWGKEYVEYDAGEGRVRALPLGWTDAAGEDPQTVIGGER